MGKMTYKESLDYHIDRLQQNENRKDNKSRYLFAYHGLFTAHMMKHKRFASKEEIKRFQNKAKRFANK